MELTKSIDLTEKISEEIVEINNEYNINVYKQLIQKYPNIYKEKKDKIKLPKLDMAPIQALNPTSVFLTTGKLISFLMN